MACVLACFGLQRPPAAGPHFKATQKPRKPRQLSDAIHRAAVDDNVAELERLLSWASEEPGQLEQLLNCLKKGETALYSAASAGSLRVVQWLLQKGASAWVQDKLGGRTPLHIACLHGHAAVAKALLDGVNDASYKDVRSLSGYTPLHYAAASGDDKTVHVLLDRAPAALTPVNDFTAYEGHMEAVAGTTPLHMAAGRGSLSVVLKLLKHYAERAESQRTPDPRTLKNSQGHQPWHIARHRKFNNLAYRVLHPDVPLQELFPSESLRPVGVRSLQTLASRALQQHLLATIAEAEPSTAMMVLLPSHMGVSTPESSHHGGACTSPCYDDASHHSCDDASSSSSQAAQPPQCSEGAQGAAACRGGSGCGDGGDVDDDDVCGICFDAVGGVRVAGCGHALCAGCAGQLARQVRRSPVACPFCRGPIGGFCARG